MDGRQWLWIGFYAMVAGAVLIAVLGMGRRTRDE